MKVGISYYREHCDRINAGRRKRYAEDREYREKAIQHACQYRLKNPEKVAACKKRWYNEHREKILEQHRIYYREHREQCLASSHRWAKQHPESVNASSRRWAKKNPEKVNAIARRWRERHPEYQHQWRQENLEKIAIKEARRRARKQDVANTLTLDQIEFERKIGEAIYPDEKLHLHHLVPFSKGGGHTWGNIAFIPSSLNLSIRDKLPEEVYKQLELITTED